MNTTHDSAAALERVGRALSDTTRARILLLLVDGPAYPSALADALGTTRSNLSNHLTCLRGCGLVRTVPEGRRVRYELVDEHLGPALRELGDIALAEHCDYCDGRARRAG